MSVPWKKCHKVICPKTGKTVTCSKKLSWLKWIFPVTGLLSLLWFLIRVIPKPSRAAYPCQRLAFPVASGFIIWLVGLFASITIFKKAKELLRQSRLKLALLSFIIAGVLGFITFLNMPHQPASAAVDPAKIPNQPIGIAKGIHPGRVVWVYAPEATTWDGVGDDHWWEPNHANQAVVDEMMAQGICGITGEPNTVSAWNKIFRYYNQTHGKGDVGYQPGEKITIKVNLVGFIYYSGRVKPETYDINTVPANTWTDWPNASPQMMKALLRQLVNVVGVNQSDICIGDPLSYFANEFYNMLHPEFPNVHYLDKEGKFGRTVVQNSTVPFYWSCRPTGVAQDYVLTTYADADYIINMPNFKVHSAAITLCGKNHYGSFIRYPSQTGYYSLHETACGTLPGSGHYRAMVDIMGHSQMGRKTLLCIVDGIYGGLHITPYLPVKFLSSPFNNDWTSSIFISQDPVALDSVGFDFLWSETAWASYTHLSGGDDYMHEAAEANNPASGTFYDPDHATSTTRLDSQGVHEHWNNANDKQYTRNLGTGSGIELVSLKGDYYRTWVETFRDDFNGTSLDTDKWTQFRGDSTNVVVENGNLRLVTWKPGVPGLRAGLIPKCSSKSTAASRQGSELQGLPVLIMLSG